MLQPNHPVRVRHWFSNINLHGFIRSFPRYPTYSHDHKFSPSLLPSPSPVRWLCSQQGAESVSSLFNLGVACFGQWDVAKCDFLNIYIFYFSKSSHSTLFCVSFWWTALVLENHVLHSETWKTYMAPHSGSSLKNHLCITEVWGLQMVTRKCSYREHLGFGKLKPSCMSLSYAADKQEAI